MYEKYYNDAEYCYSKGNYKEALSLFIEAIKINRTNNCLNYIGCCYLELGEYISAITIFEELIDNNPEWERPILNLGRVYLKKDEKEKALEQFERAAIINPLEEDTYYYMGVYYYSIGDYEKARELYEKSLSINIEQSETHLNLGMVYFRLKIFEKALEEFNQAYRYDNDCKDAIYNKSLVLISMKNYEESLKNLFIINSLEPDNIEIMMDIAHCYYKIGDYNEAMDWVNKLLLKDSEHNLANKLLNKLVSLRQNT